MDKQAALSKAVIGVAIVTALILMIPLVAMQFTTEVDWSIGDFIVMGALLFGAGLSFILVIRFATNMVSRIAMVMAFGTTFFMVWANLAVGLIGSGPNIGNLMYIGVVTLVIISSLRSRFTPNGMERAMHIAIVALVLVAVIELLANIPGTSVIEIIGVNGFFAASYAISGSLFRFSAQEQAPENSKG